MDMPSLPEEAPVGARWLLLPTNAMRECRKLTQGVGFGLTGLVAAHWVRILEARFGSRPHTRGPLASSRRMD